MAKGNIFLGTGRNKLGDVVLMRRNGEQVYRVRVRKISNPRTDAQLLTRLALSSASKTAQQLRGIVDHSFQGIKYGQDSVNHFVKKLATEIRSFMESSLAAGSLTAPFGTAPVIPYTAGGVGAAARALISSGDLVGVPFGFQTGSPGGMQLGNTLPSGMTIGGITVADFQTVFGIPITDQITFVVGGVEDLDYISETEIFKGIRFARCRVNFKSNLSGAQTVFTTISSGLFGLNSAVVDTTRSDAQALNIRFSVGQNSTIAVYSVGADSAIMDVTGSFTDAKVALIGVITSRYEAGAWRRSTTRLVLTPKSVTQSAIGYENGYGYNDIESVMQLAVPDKQVSEDRYLNKEPNS